MVVQKSIKPATPTPMASVCSVSRFSRIHRGLPISLCLSLTITGHYKPKRAHRFHSGGKAEHLVHLMAQRGNIVTNLGCRIPKTKRRLSYSLLRKLLELVNTSPGQVRSCSNNCWYFSTSGGLNSMIRWIAAIAPMRSPAFNRRSPVTSNWLIACSKLPTK